MKLSKPLILLYITSVVFGFTAIAQENNLGATASIILGDTAQQYSWTIALTILGMAVGFGFSSRFKDDQLYNRFFQAEIALTAISAFSAIFGFWSYANLPKLHTEAIRFISFSIAVLIGLEDAFLIRIASKHEPEIAKYIGLTMLASNLGGGLGGILYGTVLLPQFGPVALALVLGIVDGVMVIFNLIYFRRQLPHVFAYLGITGVVLASIVTATVRSPQIETSLTASLYEDVVAKEWGGQYGQKTLTCDQTGCKLFIGGQIQFSSKDEHIYHELLVHPAMGYATKQIQGRKLNVLIAGGGDGLAAREILKYDQVEKITIVDLDPVMTNQVAVEEPVATYNQRSLFNPRVTVHNNDAFVFLRDSSEYYDVIIVDLVDPDNQGTAKLYSKEFYEFCKKHLSHDGVMVSQSASPWYTRQAFWAINTTMASVFQTTVPYHYNIPSFGEWGFNLASKNQLITSDDLIEESKTRWLNNTTWTGSQAFSKDQLQTRQEISSTQQISTIAHPTVMIYYLASSSWDDWEEK